MDPVDEVNLLAVDSRKYKFGPELGRGTYGVVVEVGKNKVAKIQPYEFPEEVDEEVRIAEWASEHGVGPTIFDHWESNGHYVIIMKRYDYTLSDQKVSKDTYKTIRHLLVKLNEEGGYCHEDLDGANVMLNVRDGKVTEVVLIDFGQPSMTDTENCDIDGIINSLR